MDTTKEVFPQGVEPVLELVYGPALHRHVRDSFVSSLVSAFFYDQDLDAYWRLQDYSYIKAIAKKNYPHVSKRHSLKFLVNGIMKRLKSDSLIKANCRLSFFFYPSRNGIVIVDFKKKNVTKIITPLQSEPEFLINELNAYKHFHEHVPKVLQHKVINGEYFSLCSEYLENETLLTWREWPLFLKKMMPDLFEYYKKSGITVQTTDEYLRSLANDMSHYRSKKYPYLQEELSHIYTMFLRILKKLGIKQGEVKQRGMNYSNVKLFKTRVHGDLTPNNIIINDGRYYIYDWANGGHFNIFYDLMIQEFYNPDSKFWKGFMNRDPDFIKDLITKSFYHVSTDFITRVEKLTGENFITGENANIKLFQFSILVSLLELSFKNFYNYQFCDLASGKRMLDNVITILQNVEG